MHACVCACVSGGGYGAVVRVRSHVSSLMVLCLTVLKQDPSVTQKLAFKLGWLASELLGLACLHPPMMEVQVCAVMPRF